MRVYVHKTINEHYNFIEYDTDITHFRFSFQDN